LQKRPGEADYGKDGHPLLSKKEDIMEHAEPRSSTLVQTSLGTVEYIDSGQGKPVLFVHGSPGGCDQGAVMGAFLVPQGFRVIAPSRRDSSGRR
jgi:pimeloyl-ACP methyl ester carboxylesterase